MPRRNPKDAPNTRALNIKTNHIGSIPTAPAPSGRSAEINAAKTPNSATDLASNRADEISKITNANAAAIAIQTEFEADLYQRRKKAIQNL